MKVRIKGTLVEGEFICYTDVSQTIAVVQFKKDTQSKIPVDELSTFTFDVLKNGFIKSIYSIFTPRTDIKVKMILGLISLYLTTMLTILPLSWIR